MTPSHPTSRPLRGLLALSLSGGLLLSVLLAVSQAQVTLDGSLGPKKALAGPNYVIPAGVGQQRGPNLFHSFGTFNVPTGGSATFTGPRRVDNILSRVTGGNQSVIDGRLTSAIPGANLYLLNPHGVVFGPNASLDVTGSFHVSTADHLRLADGARFAAHGSDARLLSVAPPAAFGFVGAQPPARIAVRGSSLRVPEGETLSVVGGDIKIAGEGGPVTSSTAPTLEAPHGRIHIVSVASAGEVRVKPLQSTATGEVGTFEHLGHVAVRHGARLDVSGNGGGTVVIRGGKLVFDNSVIAARTLGDGHEGSVDVRGERLALTNGAQVITNTSGSGHAGKVTVTATEAISIVGSASALFANTFGHGDAGQVAVSTPALTMRGGKIQAASSTTGDGPAGAITVEVGQLRLRDGAEIDSGTHGLEQGGNVTVTATEAIYIGEGSGLFSNTFSQGDAGRVTISTPTLTMVGGFIGANAMAGSEGNAGVIRVQADRLRLRDGAQIASSTRGSGQGERGTMTIRARESIVIAGHNSADPTFKSGLFSNTFSQGDAGRVTISTPTLTMVGGYIQAVASKESAGSAGVIRVQADRLRLRDGAQIDNSSYGPGRGKGGAMTIRARESIVIAGHDSADPTLKSGLFSKTFGSGDAGPMSVEVGRLTLTKGARIDSSTNGSGQGGTLTVTADTISLTEGAQISSSTSGTGQGGMLTVIAQDSIAIAGRDSQDQSAFLSNAFGKGPTAGDAGDLFISAPTLTMHGGRITARTVGDGDAGDVTVRVGRLTLTGGAQIFNGIGSLEIIDGRPVFEGTGGPGQGGDLTVVATDSITIAGQGQGFKSGLFSNAHRGTGRAGDLLVATPWLDMQGGLILASTEEASSGDAGALMVEVGTLTLRKGAQISTNTSGTGQGGTLTITATEDVTLTGRARITSSSTGQQAEAGDAGNIHIRVTETFSSTQGAVTTEAARAGGGNIRLEAEVVHLANSHLTAAAEGPEGVGSNGGNVTIRAEQVAINRSQVSANAFGGQGGNIAIMAEVFLADAETCLAGRCLDASSQLGLPGTVAIQAPVTEVSGSLALLPQSLVRTPELLSARCTARLQTGKVSSFVVRGRDGVPATPGGVLSIPLYLAHPELSDAAGAGGQPEETAVARVGVRRFEHRAPARERTGHAQGLVPATLALECTR